jgi:hypothetical protein
MIFSLVLFGVGFAVTVHGDNLYQVGHSKLSLTLIWGSRWRSFSIYGPVAQV